MIFICENWINNNPLANQNYIFMNVIRSQNFAL